MITLFLAGGLSEVRPPDLVPTNASALSLNRSHSKMSANPSAFLDLAIGDIAEHEKLQKRFKATQDFCSNCGPMYGLPEQLDQLESEQRDILSDAFSSMPDWATKGPLCFEDPGAACSGRIRVDLFKKEAPKAVENFLCLCTGERGLGKSSKKPLHYKGVSFHRIVRGFCFQGGDVVKGDGSGGDSIHGASFNDEKPALKLKHSGPGVLSMANSGKNSNSSQFFFTLAAAPQCDGKHVVFGEVAEGLELLQRIDEEAASEDGTPKIPVTVLDCGVISR